jgi:hypothetical protein
MDAYRNTTYGFELSYPKEWQITENPAPSQDISGIVIALTPKNLNPWQITEQVPKFNCER